MRQPDHEYEERSFGDIQRAIDFENSMNDLESQLYYQHLSPKEVAQQVLKATCQFYDADWCGLIQVDLDLNLWTPFWWFNAGATDKTMLLTEEYAERKNHLQDLQTQRNKAEKDLLALKTEVLACIKGESVLPRETLAEMITAQEEKLTELENLCEAASEELEKTAELMDKVSRLYDELISYADLYDSANFEAKKMIVNQLIRRVDVYRGYQINISFNFDLTPYIEGE